MMSPPTDDPVVQTTRRPKRILLFSDGTGNSSGKLFKTNVWRLYETVDLKPRENAPDAAAAAAAGAPAPDPEPDQIAYYSNGVGTSAWRPIAAITGIFGFGLKANVLDLYKYLCRNWQPDDEIFAFGFSRGAFTIRLLVGLIVSQGILRGGTDTTPPAEDRLAYQARAAYRAFSGESWPNRSLARGLARIIRVGRDALLALHRKLAGHDRYEIDANAFTDIAFVGVWDTVAAYGGPIVEITRGIDDWIWPLTLPNYQLSPRVLTARHALALDDERDAFQPLLWDEVREQMLVRVGGAIRIKRSDKVATEIRKVADGRLKQVWFAGVHADVGGGYPDDSLSYVSLLWMLDEIGPALRFLPEAVRHIASMANSYGPMHDSRAGLAGYYRYQPRPIDALVSYDGEKDAGAFARRTFSLRDPEFADKRYEIPGADAPQPQDVLDLAARIRSDHGLLRSVRVHESVIARIVSGTDSYAPVSLPRRYDIVFATRTGDSPRLLDRAVAANIRTHMRDQNDGDHWGPRQRQIWDMVWWRRILYFATAICSSLLLLMPLWNPRRVLPDWFSWCNDARCLAQPILDIADKVSGGYLHPWARTFAHNFLVTSVLALAVVILFVKGNAYQLELRGRSRQVWRLALGLDREADHPTPPRGIARVRETTYYQRLVSDLKWYVAPFLTGMAMIAATLWLVAALATQIALANVERHDLFCKAPPADSGSGSFALDIRASCNPVAFHVDAHQHYFIRLSVTGPIRTADGSPGWHDGSIPGTPAAGHGADLPWWADMLGVPFRRVIMAGWLQPLVEVRAPRRGGVWERIAGREVRLEQPAFTCDAATGGYLGRLDARIDGSIAMFANDAMIPWLVRDDTGVRPRFTSFYDNDAGTAVVQIWKGDVGPPPAVAGIIPCTVATQ